MRGGDGVGHLRPVPHGLRYGTEQKVVAYFWYELPTWDCTHRFIGGHAERRKAGVGEGRGGVGVRGSYFLLASSDVEAHGGEVSRGGWDGLPTRPNCRQAEGLLPSLWLPLLIFYAYRTRVS